MPYENTADLPEAVKKLSDKKQRQFMHVFNSAYAKCKEDGGEDCESSAFAQANGVTKSEKAMIQCPHCGGGLDIELEAESPEEDTQEPEEEGKAGARHSRGDTGMVQTIHDHSVKLGAACGESKTADVKLSPPDNSLKAISETETELRVGNYLALFNGRDLEGLANNRKNQDGSTGEYFSKATDFHSTYTDTGMLYVDFEHGNSDLHQDEVLGYVDWKSAQIDDRGLFVERVLNRRNKYVQWLKPLIEQGLIGTSSEPVQSRVNKAADGHIIRWPLKRDTLTVSPMEPRMLSENSLTALKALAGEVSIIKSACLKSGLLGNHAAEMDIQAKLAYIKSMEV